MTETGAARVLALAALFALSGCTAVAPGGAPSAQGTPTPGWDGDPDNPYRQETLTVAVENGVNDSRAFAPLVRAAADYWERNAEQYAGYPVAYEVRPDAEDPDVVVAFVESVDCGDEDHAAGCADVIDSPGQFDPPLEVRIAGGFSDASTVDVLKHEFGHTLGLTHGDEPQEVMTSQRNLTTLPQPDASERALPWDDADFSVYLDVSNLPPDERDPARRQVRAAVGYFADGAEGTVPENVTYTFTDNRSAADVTVVFVDDLECQSGAGSCGALFGEDPDGDGRLETYASLEVTISDIDTDAVAWHTGRWLGRGFGFEESSDYPPPLRENATYEERRSEWWT
jgi:hypothetical protein